MKQSTRLVSLVVITALFWTGSCESVQRSLDSVEKLADSIRKTTDETIARAGEPEVPIPDAGSGAPIGDSPVSTGTSPQAPAAETADNTSTVTGGASQPEVASAPALKPTSMVKLGEWGGAWEGRAEYGSQPGTATAMVDRAPVLIAVDDQLNKLAIVRGVGSRFAVELNGQRGLVYDEILAIHGLAMSANGEHLVYVGRRSDSFFVVVNGEEGPAFSAVPRFVMDRATGRYAYVAARKVNAEKPQQVVMLDRQVVAEMVYVGELKFLADGRLWITGQETDDGRSRPVLNVGGKWIENVTSHALAPDGRLVFLHHGSAGESWLTIEGQEAPIKGALTLPIFSRNGLHFAYPILDIGLDNTKTVSIVCGERTYPNASVELKTFGENLVVSQGGDLAYVREGSVVTAEGIGPSYQRIQGLCFPGDASKPTYLAGQLGRNFLVTPEGEGDLILGRVKSLDMHPNGGFVAFIRNEEEGVVVTHEGVSSFSDSTLAGPRFSLDGAHHSYSVHRVASDGSDVIRIYLDGEPRFEIADAGAKEILDWRFSESPASTGGVTSMHWLTSVGSYSPRFPKAGKNRLDFLRDGQRLFVSPIGSRGWTGHFRASSDGRHLAYWAQTADMIGNRTYSLILNGTVTVPEHLPLVPRQSSGIMDTNGFGPLPTDAYSGKLSDDGRFSYLSSIDGGIYRVSYGPVETPALTPSLHSAPTVESTEQEITSTSGELVASNLPTSPPGYAKPTNMVALGTWGGEYSGKIHLSARPGTATTVLNGSTEQIAVSADMRYLAATRSVGSRFAVELNGERGPVFDEILAEPGLMFSPSGERFAYVGRRGKSHYVVIDGVEGPPLGSTFPALFVFGSQNEQLAYAAAQGGEGSAVKYDALLDHDVVMENLQYVGEVYFAPDGRLVVKGAIGEKHKAKPVLLHGDQVIRNFSAYGLAPDGRLLWTENDASGNSSLFIEGMPEPFEGAISLPVFSRNGKHFAYVTQRAGSSDRGAYSVVSGGKTYPYSPFDLGDLASCVVISETGEVAIASRTSSGRAAVATQDGLGPECDRVQALTYPGSATRPTYLATDRVRCFLIAPGREDEVIFGRVDLVTRGLNGGFVATIDADQDKGEDCAVVTENGVIAHPGSYRIVGVRISDDGQHFVYYVENFLANASEEHAGSWIYLDGAPAHRLGDLSMKMVRVAYRFSEGLSTSGKPNLHWITKGPRLEPIGSARQSLGHNAYRYRRDDGGTVTTVEASHKEARHFRATADGRRLAYWLRQPRGQETPMVLMLDGVETKTAFMPLSRGMSGSRIAQSELDGKPWDGFTGRLLDDTRFAYLSSVDGVIYRVSYDFPAAD